MKEVMTVDVEMLRLLHRFPPLNTADAWDGIFGHQAASEAKAPAAASSSSEAAGRGLLGRSGGVLPFLPEYSTIGPSLTALMQHCQTRYPLETSAVIRRWLHEGTRLHPRFRQWLLCDWLKRSHLQRTLQSDQDADGERERLLWHEALAVAAVGETQQPLKRVLLLMLDEVGALSRGLERQGESDGEANREQAIASDSQVDANLEPLNTVAGLLDFCWLHAEKLARFAMLCTAKLRRVFVERASTGPLADQEEIGVRMRWYLMAKPVLFEPILRHGLALGVFTVQPDSPSSYHLVVPSENMRLVVALTLHSDDSMQRLDEAVDRLRTTYNAKAVHVRPGEFQHRIFSIDTPNTPTELRSLSSTEKTRLLEEFDRDLDEAPTHLFPHVLVAFAIFLATCCSSGEASEFDKKATSLLFDTFERQAVGESGGSSCLQVLAVVLDLQIARLRVWRDVPQLYVDMCELLHTNTTLQVDASAQWAAQMALQQLLLECDVSVLEASLAALSAFLPDRLLRLARLRMRGPIKE